MTNVPFSRMTKKNEKKNTSVILSFFHLFTSKDVNLLWNTSAHRNHFYNRGVTSYKVSQLWLRFMAIVCVYTTRIIRVKSKLQASEIPNRLTESQDLRYDSHRGTIATFFQRSHGFVQFPWAPFHLRHLPSIFQQWKHASIIIFFQNIEYRIFEISGVQKIFLKCLLMQDLFSVRD